MLALLLLTCGILFVAGYVYYGRFLSKAFALDDANRPPSEELLDGIDYCPTHPGVLAGHHFASIAGAGPIVGPIAAAVLFGWAPALVWCVVGAIFIGGVHDMGALVASVRHRGRSIGEVIDCWIGRRGKRLFLGFTWLSLVLVNAVFLHLSAETFSQDAAVAFSGVLYIPLAAVFGVVIYRCRLSLGRVTLAILPVVLGAIWYGNRADWVQEVFSFSAHTWRIILVGYIFFASVLPVWLLLQPRDYLASFVLYFSLAVGSAGIILGAGRFQVTLPAFKSFHPSEGDYLWPFLFITVACGAVSGFHSMVASGTTSKQLRRETDARVIGYGSMLLEGVLAVVAVATVMMSGSLIQKDPSRTFGQGFSQFAAVLGVSPKVGISLGLLAINTFILTSLDTATRLARYQLQELTNMKLDRYTATVISVGAAMGLLYIKAGDVPAWRLIWPAFGASNQLVAALVLLTLAIWVAKGLRKKATFLVAPMVFMLVTTFAALILLMWTNAARHQYAIVALAGILLVLAALLIREAYVALRFRPAVEGMSDE